MLHFSRLTLPTAVFSPLAESLALKCDPPFPVALFAFSNPSAPLRFPSSCLYPCEPVLPYTRYAAFASNIIDRLSALNFTIAS
jgi:hypothetical protein